MSSSIGALPSELAASREDFELFRRLMRVARLMELQDNNNNISANPERALTASTQHAHPGGDLFYPDTDVLLGYTNVRAPSAQDDFNYNFNYDDEDDEDDDDDEKTRQGSLLDPQLFRPFVQQNPPATPQSIRSSPRNRRRSIKTPTQRQAQSQAQEEENEQPKRRKTTQQDLPEQRPHAAVERRYRSVINSKIKQLNDLVPPSNTYSTPGLGKQPAERDPKEGDKVPTKAVVLDRALEYINNLVSTYEKYEKERNDIHGKLKIWLDEFDTVGESDTVDA